MPGFTKKQLVEKALDPKRYAWCKHCRLYWSRRSLAKHRRSIESGDILKIDMPPIPTPKKGDVLIINPACERFIDTLVDLVVKDLLARPPAREADKTTRSSRKRKEPRHSEPEYDVLTVDEAVARLGVSKEDVMAAFEQATVPIEVTLK
jgi:hypothetical protein